MPPGPKSDPSANGEEGKPSPLERLRRAMLRPGPDGGYAPDAVKDLSVEELQAAQKAMNDRERLVGLVVAPIAAFVGLLEVDNSISHDPAQYLSKGLINPKYVNISLYHELLVVLLVMAFLIMVTAYLRKRFFMGMVMALYGLAIFNLHGYGFGIPFILGGAWFLVRTYRLSQSLKAAGVETTGFHNLAPPRPEGVLPKPNKRYTPRMAPRRKPQKPESAS
jgi:hypothetical protein